MRATPFLPVLLAAEVERETSSGEEETGDAIDITATHVVLATGLNSVPVMPSWPGVESFTGTLIHAAEYRNATAYRGRDVLVVGVGNSGTEIAADLAESGAGRVWMAVRRARTCNCRMDAGSSDELTRGKRLSAILRGSDAN